MKLSGLYLWPIAFCVLFILSQPVQAVMVNVENFESYNTSAELGNAWTVAVGSPVVTLETGSIYGGSHAMAVKYSGKTAPFTNLVSFTFGSNQNWSTDTEFSFNCGGLTNTNDNIIVQLIDQTGDVLGTHQIVGGTLRSSSNKMVVDISSGAGLQSMRGIRLGVVASAAKDTGTVWFDNLQVGNRGVLSVLGSSLAHGSKSSGDKNNQYINGSFMNGYATDLTVAQATNGWRVVNQSVDGDTTTRVEKRFYRDEVPVHADEALIGLSLGNEGLARSSNPQAVFNHFFTGTTNLVAMLRANNILPLVGGQYPKNDYSSDEYVYLKKMDLLLNTLDVPSVNFLGATDDGSGHWVNNKFINLGSGDGTHPNDAGYYEMFLTIVPSVFDAVKAGKPTPRWGNRAKFLRLTDGSGRATSLGFTPSLIMHSFTESFRVRSASTGTIASITLPASKVHPVIEMTPNGLDYVGVNGVVNDSHVSGTNNVWHEMVVAHSWARGRTFFYVDGVLAGTVAERLTPIGFVLGGRGDAMTCPGSPAQADCQNWFVYRSMLNSEEVNAQYHGDLQQASLDLYAPLDDNSFTPGAAVTNLAQSLSAAVVNGK